MNYRLITGFEVSTLWKILVFTWVTTNTAICYAQNTRIDSLEKELSKAQPDTLKVHLLNDLAFTYSKINVDKGIAYGLQSVDLAITLDFKKGLARAYNSLGAGHWSKGTLDSALMYYKEAFKVSHSIQDVKRMSGLLNNMALIYSRQGENLRAIESYQQALEIMKANNFEKHVVSTYVNLGLSFYRIGNFDEAFHYQSQAQLESKRLGYENIEGRAWLNIGNIYKQLKEPQKRLAAQDSAIKIGYKTDDMALLGMALNNKGLTYMDLKNWGKAISNFEEAYKINKKVGRQRSQIKNLMNIGQVNFNREEYSTAMDYFEKAIAQARTIGYSNAEGRSLYFIGQTTEKLSGCSEALNYYLQAFDISEKEQTLIDLKDVAEVLYLCYSKLGQYKEAYFYQHKFMVYSDSMLNEDKLKTLVQNNANFEFEKEKQRIELEKQQEIALAEAQEKTANLRLVLVVVFVVIILVVGFLITRTILIRKERKRKELEALSQFKESMTGMFAHDLKNPLNTILSNTEVNSPVRQTVQQMVTMINDMMQVHKFETTEVKLNRSEVELSQLVNECIDNVSGLLKKKSIQVVKEMSMDIQVMADREIIFRVLINLLTNAIKYSPVERRLIIGASWIGDNIRISIQDFGIGIATEELGHIFKPYAQLDPRKSGEIQSTGLGLTFCKLAVESHGSTLHVESSPGEGTTFSFELPSANSDANDKTIILTKNDFRVRLNDKDQSKVLSVIEELRGYHLHNAYKIEKLLDELGLENDEFKNSLLDSAYSGNQEAYDHQLDMLDKTSD